MEQEHENPAAAASFLESVRLGDITPVTRLLRQNPDLANVADRVGWTGLMTAVAARHVPMVKLLLAHGADPHRRSPTDGMNALHVLAEQGPRDFSSTDSDEVEESKAASKLLSILLDAGVDPNARNNSGETVLHLLCLRGNVDSVCEVLSRRAITDIDAVNGNGETALHCASRKGYTKIVDLLQSHGASHGAATVVFHPLAQIIDVERQQREEEEGETVNQPPGVIADQQEQISFLNLPPESIVHVLSFVGDAHDLCSVATVCRSLAALSKEDCLWRPLGHQSWADTHAREHGWKGAYIKWLRLSIAQYRRMRQKIVLAGVQDVGKSAMVRRYVVNDWLPYGSESTIGASFLSKTSTWKGADVKLELWDTAGMEKYRSLLPMYLRGADGVLLVYDVTNRQSFESTVEFMATIRKISFGSTSVVLVGSRADLVEERTVTTLEGRQQADEWGVPFCECSAKTGEGVIAAFDLLVNCMMKLNWMNVPDMATPSHVPSEDLIDDLLEYVASTAATKNSTMDTKGPQPRRCLLQ